MFRIVRGALRARRSQAATVLLLTALAVGIAAAAPWYVAAAARSVAVADVAEAPANQLVVRASGRVEGGVAIPNLTGASLVDAAAGAGEDVVRVPGAGSVVSLREGGALMTGVVRVPLTLGYRDAMCDNLTVEGACPRGPQDVLVSRRTAELLQAGIGDSVMFASTSVKSRPLRVVGTYELRDPYGRYWALTALGGARGLDESAQPSGDPAFVSADAFATLPLREVVVEYHLMLPDSVFLGPDGGAGLVATLDRASVGAGTFRVESGANNLSDRIVRERRLVDLGVGVAAVQLLLLCWFGLYFAVRHTAEQRRPDVGLLKLRGTRGWRLWGLAWGQSAAPMIGGAVLGAVLGAAYVLFVAGDVGDPADARAAAVTGGVAALAALVGTLVAATVADLRGMRAGVTDLLRHVPARRRGWRGDVVDLVVVLLAAAGLYQAQVAADTGGLALLAPALIAVVVALVAARALTPLAGRVGRSALRDGRVPLALGATQLARRPGTHRVFALLVVAVALVTTAFGGWAASVDARAERAVQQVGADRVLTVQARSRAHLLAAVRAADPDGRYAMAVVRGEAGRLEDVLAVDAARFARVTAWQEAYGGPGPAALAALIRPSAPQAVPVPDGLLTADAALAGIAGEAPLYLVVRLASGAGADRSVRLGPLSAERTAVTAEVSGCGAAGCRLVGFELRATTAAGRMILPEGGRGVAIHGLTARGGPVLPPELLADVSRWRTSVSNRVTGPVLDATDGALTVAASDGLGSFGRSTLAYLVDAPVPLPIIRAGRDLTDDLSEVRLSIFGADAVPVRTVGVTAALPYAVATGYLVDLEYADRVASGASVSDVPQVWLARGAPADLVDRLAAQGLGVLADDSIAAAGDRLDRQGPPSALRFQLVAALAGLLLTAGAFTVVAAVERPERAHELAALRMQGLRPPVVRAVAYGGYGGLALAAVLLGVAAGALAMSVTRRPLPLFVDGWGVLPVDVGPQPVPMLLALFAGALVVGAVALAAASRLVRTVRAFGPGGPQ